MGGSNEVADDMIPVVTLLEENMVDEPSGVVELKVTLMDGEKNDDDNIIVESEVTLELPSGP